jgi:hypothetical protein
MERTAQQLYRENLIQRFNDPDLQDFVQSTINILSDGIDIDDINGLKLESKGGNKRLISFYEKIKNKSSLWDISLGQTEQKHNSLNIAANDKTLLSIVDNGCVGIGKVDPSFHLDVDGLVSSTGRVGSFAVGKVPADGEWHTLLNNLSGTIGFEALAHIINGTEERYALTYGILLMSEKKGNKNKVRSVDAASSWLWGRWLNKILFRWTKDEASSTDQDLKYKLEMKSRTRQGMPGLETPYVYYRLAKIWDKQYETGIDLNVSNIYSTTYGKAASPENKEVEVNTPLTTTTVPKRTISIKPK